MESWRVYVHLKVNFEALVVCYTDIEKGITVFAEKDYLLEQLDLFNLSEAYCCCSHEDQGSSATENTVIVDLMEQASEGSGIGFRWDGPCAGTRSERA
jgi:hypothetical protein